MEKENPLSKEIIEDPSSQGNKVDATICDNQTLKLSKRQLRKLKKKQTWLENLPAKRAKEKLKMKQKRAEARKMNIFLGPTRQRLKNSKMSTSKCKVRVAFDFSFDHLMVGKDICKCINQILRCYSNNRRAANPLQLHLVNFNGESKKEMSKHSGYENWDVNIHQQSYLDLFAKESLVYLSSESDNVIETFGDDKVYIIGALVDHNSQKGLCFNIAKEQGIQHGQLPIGDFMQLKSRKVLAINHVFDIVLKVCNGATWKEALLEVMPQRKLATTASSCEVNVDQEEQATEDYGRNIRDSNEYVF